MSIVLMGKVEPVRYADLPAANAFLYNGKVLYKPWRAFDDLPWVAFGLEDGTVYNIPDGDLVSPRKLLMTVIGD